MGAVFEALERKDGRRVALKVVQNERLAGEPCVRAPLRARGARGRRSQSARTSSRLLHAGCDGESGAPYIAMELLEGEDLRQLLRRAAPLDPDLALRIVVQACQGLVDAHALGVVHRDIKPANIFLARKGDDVVVKLLDFGLAKLARSNTDEESASLTGSGSMLGSPAYMSPEQALGYEDSDARSDLWSLGVVLYEALSGRSPFGERATLGQVILAICSEAPPALRDLAPWVSAEASAIAHRALHEGAKRSFRHRAATCCTRSNSSCPTARRFTSSVLAGGAAGRVGRRRSSPPSAIGADARLAAGELSQRPRRLGESTESVSRDRLD